LFDTPSTMPRRGMASATYLGARQLARRLGVGRLRSHLRQSVQRSPWWVTVPPRRVKDLDLDRTLPSQAIALTFDDGPDPIVTPRLLELLEQYSARATFFLCGLSAERHPDLVRAIVTAGHSVGGHTWDHTQRMVRGISPIQWQRQVDDTHQILTELSGKRIRWFRPPRGITDRYTWHAMRRQDVTTVLWSVDGRDCTLRDPNQIANGVLAQLTPGDIVLLHDANAAFLFAGSRPRYGDIGNQESTLQATEMILHAAHDRRLRSVSLDTLADRTMLPSSRPRLLT
jgi:peptidoglycan/xylan/chitin deacetylase (PgdA/CDA1 family)